MTAKYRLDGLHLDASEQAFFSRQLEHVRNKSRDVLFPEFKGRRLVAVDHEADPADEVITYETYQEVGYAEWAKDKSKGPRVDLFGKETTTPVRGMKASYAYSLDEMRKSMKTGKDLPGRKANAARRAIEQLIDDAIFIGSGPGLKGLLNQTGTTVYTVPNGAAASPTWALKTPDEILKDLFGIESKIISDTLEIERPDTLLLPLSSYQLIATKRLGDGSDTTILKHFLETAVSITRVERTHKLESAVAAGVPGAWTGKRMVAYNASADKLQAPVPLEYSQLPPQVDGFEVITHCEARSGGVVLYYPKSLAYGDGI
jgi:hypothetical protein